MLFRIRFYDGAADPKGEPMEFEARDLNEAIETHCKGLIDRGKDADLRATLQTIELPVRTLPFFRDTRVLP